MSLKQYDLAGTQPERRFSPYCWWIRMALAQKAMMLSAFNGLASKAPAY
jgi:hypothetical protein